MGSPPQTFLPSLTQTHTDTQMPGRKSPIAFVANGKPVSFRGTRKPKSPAKSLKQLRKRLRKLNSPVMRANAERKWKEARGMLY